MKCKNCARYVHVNEDNERTVGKPNWCFYISDSPCADLECDCKAFTPLRNADRFRAMTDEELAEELFRRDLDVINQLTKAGGLKVNIKCDKESCIKSLLGWLKQEVDK